MPITRLEPQRLYRQIADQIQELIRSGEFPPGSRLPPERTLAAQLGVSRPSLREAMIALEIAGAVTVQTGSGIYVRTGLPSAAPATAAIPDGGPGPFELIGARRVVECQIAGLAAQTALPADLDRLTAAIAQMIEEDRQGAVDEDADRLFHIALAEATRNSALVLIVQDLWDRGRGAMWAKMQERMRTSVLRPRWIEDHKAVRDAVAAGDAGAARSAMARHLENVERALSDAWEAGSSPVPVSGGPVSGASASGAPASGKTSKRAVL